jgi:hypothetical protein
MGISAAGVQFLLAARAAGASFSQTATIGKQGFFATVHGIKPIIEATNFPLTARGLVDHCGGNGDRFLELLGAERVTSIDASDYEGATVVHDMNRPIGQDLHNRFTAVFDGGCLEHIFDVRQALLNCMDLVQVGGHFLGQTTANNLLGHGFYQFSPELFFRVFCPDNGFQLEGVLLCLPYDLPPTFYAVPDPADLGERIYLQNNKPTYLMVVARKVRHGAGLASLPQQSDYVSAWTDRKGPRAEHPPVARAAQRGLRRLAGLLPVSIVRPLRTAKSWFRAAPGFRQSCYRRLSLDELADGHLARPLPAPLAGPRRPSGTL